MINVSSFVDNVLLFFCPRLDNQTLKLMFVQYSFSSLICLFSTGEEVSPSISSISAVFAQKTMEAATSRCLKAPLLSSCQNTKKKSAESVKIFAYSSESPSVNAVSDKECLADFFALGFASQATYSLGLRTHDYFHYQLMCRWSFWSIYWLKCKKSENNCPKWPI